MLNLHGQRVTREGLLELGAQTVASRACRYPSRRTVGVGGQAGCWLRNPAGSVSAPAARTPRPVSSLQRSRGT